MPYNSDKWATSEGEDRCRRSLYTFWRRTSPYPSFMTFDATSREFCQVRRVRTNTPLQALTLLNDPASFPRARPREASAARGARPAPRDRVNFAIKLVLSAKPGATRRCGLSLSTTASVEHYQHSAADAAEVLQIQPLAQSMARNADLAAWTIVADALLNLDEAVTKQ